MKLTVGGNRSGLDKREELDGGGSVCLLILVAVNCFLW